MKGNVYTLGYAAILGTVCALLLTAASSFTAPYRAANAEAEEILNVLTALKVSFQADASPEQLVEIFNTNVRHRSRGDQTLYEYCPLEVEGKIQAVAVRFSGRHRASDCYSAVFNILWQKRFRRVN